MGKNVILYFWAIFLMIVAIAILYLLVRVIFKVSKDPDMKWYRRMKWHLKEIRKTLSNEPSAYSSKRVERMLLFVNANIMLDIITYTLLQKDKISPAEAVLIYGAQMVYAGFQTKQISKDIKPNDGTNNNTEAPTT